MIQTLSNLTIIIYAIAVMTMLLDTTPARLSRNKLSLLWAGAGIIALLQFFAGCVLGIKISSSLLFFFAQLPVFLLFWQLSGKGLVKTFFATLSAIFMCVPAMFASRISREFLPVSKTVDYLFLLFDQSYHALAHSPFYAAGLWAAARYFFVPGHFKIQRYSISL